MEHVVRRFNLLLVKDSSNLKEKFRQFHRKLFNWTFQLNLSTELFNWTFQLNLSTELFNWTFQLNLSTELFNWTFQLNLSTELFNWTFQLNLSWHCTEQSYKSTTKSLLHLKFTSWNWEVLERIIFRVIGKSKTLHCLLIHLPQYWLNFVGTSRNHSWSNAKNLKHIHLFCDEWRLSESKKTPCFIACIIITTKLSKT